MATPTNEKIVSYRLDKMDERLAAILDRLDNIIEHQHLLDKRQSVSEVKSGAYGTFGGALTVVLALFFDWFKKHT